MRQLFRRTVMVMALAVGLISFSAALPALAGNLQPPVTLALVPSTQSVRPGQQFTVSVFLNMPSSSPKTLSPHLIDFVHMSISFDPTVLTAINFQPVYPPFMTIQGPVINNTNGTAALDIATGFTTNFLQKAANVATLTFQASAGDHAVSPINWVSVQALSASGNDQAAENVAGVAYGTTICVDSALPACHPLAPAASIPLTRLGTNSVKVKLSWGATDATGVLSYGLQQSTNGRAFTDVALWPPATTTITRSLTAGNGYQFRVNFTDGLGNPSSYAVGPDFEVNNNGNSLNQAFRVLLYDDTTKAVAYSRGWASGSLRGAYRGSVHHATSKGKTVKFAVRSAPVSHSTDVSQSQSIAWVSTKGPDRGMAEVLLDGRKVATVNLYARTVQTRQVVWASNVDPARGHVLEIELLGTRSRASTGTRVDVDAFVLLR